MNRLSMLVISFLLLVAPATGAYADPQFHRIGVFPSPLPEECIVVEPVGVLTVYVVCYTLVPDCVQVLALRLASGGGFAGSYMGENVAQGSASGNTQDGMLILGVGSVTPFVVATVTYLTDGSSPTCSWLEVVPDPTYGALWGACDASEYQWDSPGRLNIIVPGAGLSGCDTWCYPVETEMSTWGRIKALYH